jgi:hypothetical protein
MMPEVRINPLSQTFGLILCRFHQGYIPARAFSLKFGRVTALIVPGRVSPSCRFVGELSITAMVIPDTIPLFRSANAEFLPQDTTSRTRRPIWMICCVGALGG